MAVVERAGEAAGVLVTEVIDRRLVRTVAQPLVELATGGVVGYECLARGPVGSPIESPLPLFDAAAQHDRVGELDWVCRSVALSEVMAAGADPTLTWFVNVEPAGLATACPPDLLPVIEQAEGRLRIVNELTERNLDQDPARVLAAAAGARRRGWGVALDDVGAEPRSLALLPLLQPDVVKLDMTLVQGGRQTDGARIANAVRAYAEETGALVLAEGIEDEGMLRAAEALGASYGQGWLFGRPAPLAEIAHLGAASALALAPRYASDEGLTPFELVRRARSVRCATKRLLLPNSLHLEHQALHGGESLVLLSSFQAGHNFTEGTRARYARLAKHNVFTAALGTRMPASAPDGVRVVELPPQDRLTGEWDVVVVGPHFAGALLARDCGDPGPDLDRRFDYVITHDRPLVLRAARALLQWVTPSVEVV